MSDDPVDQYPDREMWNAGDDYLIRLANFTRNRDVLNAVRRAQAERAMQRLRYNGALPLQG